MARRPCVAFSKASRLPCYFLVVAVDWLALFSMARSRRSLIDATKSPTTKLLVSFLSEGSEDMLSGSLGCAAFTKLMGHFVQALPHSFIAFRIE